MFLHDVCKALEKAHVPYAIVGGYAVAMHGVVRGTIDVDIAIKWTLQNLEKAEKVLKDIGLISLLPIDSHAVYFFREEYIKNRHLIAWNFYDPQNPMRQVDLLINYDLKNARTKTLKTADGKIKILSLKDLIAMKKASGRPQDLEDVKALENL